MSYSDDTDTPSSSSAAYFDSPTKAKREALKAKLKAQGLKIAQLDQKADVQSLKLSVLKGQLAGQKDEEKKRTDQAAQDAKGTSSGTKTREQALAAERGTSAANLQHSPDAAVQAEAEKAQAQDELLQQESTSDAG